MSTQGFWTGHGVPYFGQYYDPSSYLSTSLVSRIVSNAYLSQAQGPSVDAIIAQSLHRRNVVFTLPLGRAAVLICSPVACPGQGLFFCSWDHLTAPP